MGFVDGEKRDLCRTEQVAERLLTGAFGRDVEKIEIATAQPVLRFAPIGVHAGEAGGAQAHRIGGAQLVVHQRDERRYDDTAAIERGGGKLVAERFARARRHDGQRRAARHNSANHLFLHPAKGGEAEDVMQKRGNVARHRAALAAGGGKG